MPNHDDEDFDDETPPSGVPTRKERKLTRGKLPKSLRGPALQQRMADVREKRAKALELRKQGATYAQIAEQMGLSTPMVAWRYVNDALADIPKENAIGLRNLEISKIDAREVLLNSKLAKANVGETVKIVTALTKLQERRSRLLGLDAPNRTEVTGRDGAPLAMTVNDLTELSNEQLERIVDDALRQSARSGGADDAEEAAPSGDRGARRSH